MAVMRVHKTGNYTIMSNYHFKEKEMSLKAKGLLSLMLSLPEDWDYSINGLATLSKDGRDSVMGALKELEKFGYLIRTRTNDEKGRFSGYDYDIFENPQSTIPNVEEPCTDFPNTDNPQQLNTNKNNSVGINSEMNKEKKDILEKRPEADNNNNEKLKAFEEKMDSILKPNAFSKELIKADYIKEDDLFLSMYNQLFVDLMDEYDFELVRSCLWYFIKRLKNGKAYDEFGNEIINKYAYLKASLESELYKLSNPEENNPFSEESINKTLELLGK